MIQVKNIDHINMNVLNLNDSILFYRDFFGLEVKEEGQGLDKQYAVLGRSNAALLCLYETPEGQPIDTRQKIAIKHFGFYIQNFDQAVKELQERGVELLYGGVNQYPKSRSVYIQDPSGHEIELAEYFGGGL